MSSDKPHSPTDRKLSDDELIDALYDSLPLSKKSEVLAKIDSDAPSQELLQDFAKLRELSKTLYQVEPPSKMSNILLAAAAQAAHEKKKSWFERFVRPIVFQPAFAAVACAAIIGGVSLSLYEKGDKQIAIPSTTEREMAPAPPPAGSAVLPDEQAGQLKANTPTQAPADGVIGSAQSAGEGGSAQADGDLAADDAKQIEKKNKAERARSKADDLGKDVGFSDKLGEQDSKYATPPAKPDTSVSYEGRVTDEARAEEIKKAVSSKRDSTAAAKERPAQSVVPASPASSAASADQELEGSANSAPAAAPEPKEESAKESAKPQAPSKKAATLYEQAVQAAGKKLCNEVVKLVDQIRKEDLAYYKSTVAGSKALQPCLNANKK